MKDEVCADISYKKRIGLKLSGDELHYTACSLHVKSKDSCGKLHCQHVSISLPLSSLRPFLRRVGGVLALLAPAHAQVSSAIQTPPMKDEVFAQIFHEHTVKVKLSGDEVYYATCCSSVKSKNS
jgi:hypothetical protein